MTEEHDKSQLRDVACIDELSRVLARTQDFAYLCELKAKTSGVKQFASHMEWDLSERNKIAEALIRIDRRIGALLIESIDHTGADHNRMLPPGISRMKSSRLQSLARIPAAVLKRYVATQNSGNRLITAEGLRRFAGGSTRRRATNQNDVNRKRDGSRATWRTLLRFLSPTFVVGLPKTVKISASRLSSASELSVVRGPLAIGPHVDIGNWLEALNDRTGLSVPEVAVLLETTTSSPEFSQFGRSGWACCFLPDQKAETELVVGYRGPRSREFVLEFGKLGTVLIAPR